MELLPGVIADHTALWFSQHKTLCLADLHLGYEDELHAKGVHVPTGEYREQRTLIKKLFEKYEPQTIILNGDVKHLFGSINRQEWRDTLHLLDYLCERATVVIIEGNHDRVLAPIAAKKDIALVKHHKAGDVLFTHGDTVPDKKALKGIKTVVIGHEHPSITLDSGVRKEQYKCFVLASWNRKNLIVMPSTFGLTYGMDVLSKEPHGPIFVAATKKHVFVVGEDGNVLNFGMLARLQ